MQPLSVLIVDDFEDFRRFLRLALQEKSEYQIIAEGVRRAGSRPASRRTAPRFDSAGYRIAHTEWHRSRSTNTQSFPWIQNTLCEPGRLGRFVSSHLMCMRAQGLTRGQPLNRLGHRKRGAPQKCKRHVKQFSRANSLPRFALRCEERAQSEAARRLTGVRDYPPVSTIVVRIGGADRSAQGLSSTIAL